MFLGRTKKNLHKYHESFFLFLRENLTRAQIENLSLRDSLSIILSASEPQIKRFSLQRFLFSLGIRKIVQTLNSIYSSHLGHVWTLNEEFLEEGSEIEYIRTQSRLQVAPFDPKNFDWAGDEDSFIDLTSDAMEDSHLADSIESATDNSELAFLEQVNRVKLENRDELLCGNIGELPEELHSFLREELLNNFGKESFQVSFSVPRPSQEQIKEALSQNPPKKGDLQCLFELFKAVHPMITKPAQNGVFWSLFLSPEITGLELEKHFGLFAVSHVKITGPDKRESQKQLDGASGTGSN